MHHSQRALLTELAASFISCVSCFLYASISSCASTFACFMRAALPAMFKQRVGRTKRKGEEGGGRRSPMSDTAEMAKRMTPCSHTPARQQPAHNRGARLPAAADRRAQHVHAVGARAWACAGGQATVAPRRSNDSSQRARKHKNERTVAGLLHDLCCALFSGEQGADSIGASGSRHLD